MCPLYSCTALVTIYDLATDNNTDPEIFFDGYKDPYQTTGVLSLQLELEDLQPEDVDILTLSYDLKIYNPLYNYLVWTSSYAVIALVSSCSPVCHHCKAMGPASFATCKPYTRVMCLVSMSEIGSTEIALLVLGWGISATVLNHTNKQGKGFCRVLK